METSTMAEFENLCNPRSASPEDETVCSALARHENSLRDAIREIHMDIGAFKMGMERRLEEAANLNGPLGRTVTQLQQENRQLRNQLQALTRQVELLSGMMCERSLPLQNNNASNHKSQLQDIEENHQQVKEVIYGKGEAQLHVQPCILGTHGQTYGGVSSPASPPATFASSPNSSSPPTGSRVSSVVTGALSSSSPSTARFSSRATFALSNKTNSGERDEPIEVDPVPARGGLENGDLTAAVPVHGKICPPNQHTAPVAMRMPHLPITATTKAAELRGLADSDKSPTGSHSSPFLEALELNQTLNCSNPQQQRAESPIQPVSSVKTWTPNPVRSMGSPRLQAQQWSIL